MEDILRPLTSIQNLLDRLLENVGDLDDFSGRIDLQSGAAYLTLPGEYRSLVEKMDPNWMRYDGDTLRFPQLYGDKPLIVSFD